MGTGLTTVACLVCIQYATYSEQILLLLLCGSYATCNTESRCCDSGLRDAVGSVDVGRNIRM